MLHRFLLALLFIAFSPGSTCAAVDFSSESLRQAPGAAAPAPTSRAASASGSVVTTPHVRAELLAHAPEGVGPGKPVWLGLQITHQPEWHTYWKNSGDSGLPTELAWTLPADLQAGDIAWPVPQKIRIGTLANYGYGGTVLLPVPVTVAPGSGVGMQTGSADIRLRASWLVCRKECIPEQGDFTLRLPVQGSTASHGAAFAEAHALQPRAIGAGSATVDGQRLQVAVEGLPIALRGQTLEFFPETPEVIETAAEAGSGWTQQWQGGRWTASIPLAAHRGGSPEAIPAVLVARPASAGAPVQAWRTTLAVQGPWPAAPARAAVSPALQAALQANVDGAAGAVGPFGTGSAPAAPSPAAARVLGLALLGALLGGLILNLMPCVLPVLAIKVVGFATHQHDRRARQASGLAYTAGVLVSFLALGGLMLALRAAGAQLGWGFQLQSPAVVAGLAALFTLIGLNLAGMFELGQWLPGSVAGTRLRHPAADAFLSGVLAVVIASPCTAPFMGASLGLALGLPALQALAIFGAIGLGMALPYLLASWVPALARLLPRPGAWMLTFRRAMAFPMFATVAWLVWVLGQQSGIDGAGALLALLVALSAVVWAGTVRGRSGWVLVAVSIAGLVALGGMLGPNIVRVPAAAPLAESQPGERWQPWSQARVAALNGSGQAVFVDFTAAWCVTCQYNKRTTLSDPAVLADLEQRKVALLRADWTRRDPAITDALAALGRSGVPVYVLQAPGKPPVVLTEILSADELRGALERL